MRGELHGSVSASRFGDVKKRKGDVKTRPLVGFHSGFKAATFFSSAFFCLALLANMRVRP